MRDISSRSSTSRTRKWTCRSITSTVVDTTCVEPLAPLQQVQAGEERRQRVPQLMAERGEEFVFAAIRVAQCLEGLRAFGQVGANLILTLACAQRGADGADQRCDLQRTLEQRDVAQHPHRMRGVGGIRTRTCHDQDRQVRPGWLLGQDAQQLDLAAGDGFLGQQQHAGSVLQLAHDRRHRRNGIHSDAGPRASICRVIVAVSGRRRQRPGRVDREPSGRDQSRLSGL